MTFEVVGAEAAGWAAGATAASNGMISVMACMNHLAVRPRRRIRHCLESAAAVILFRSVDANISDIVVVLDKAYEDRLADALAMLKSCGMDVRDACDDKSVV